MGLDMYLYAKKRDGNPSPYRPNEEVAALPDSEKVFKNGIDATFPRPGEYYHKPGTFEVAYWRKANAVHAWFVDNVQGGQDECEPHRVTRVQLEELRDLCRDSLERRDPFGLQPRSGFFFGSTDIDEWYWKDLQDTVEMIDNSLSDPRLEDLEFVYQSSW